MRILDKRLLSVSLLTFMATTGVAMAQEPAGGGGGGGGGGGKAAGIGVGAETMLAAGFVPSNTPTAAASFVYDASMWRVNALLAMESAGATDLFLGGKFWYNLHTGVASDFAVGGGLGILFDGDDAGGPGDDDQTHFVIEAGIQLRAFVVPNVAIGGTAGIGFVILDEAAGDDFFLLGGQIMGGLGIWYFFD
jgi:hypothetical protein